MGDSVIEQAARAALSAMQTYIGGEALGSTLYTEEVIGKEIARAVLQAIREPSEAMLAAAKPEPTHLYDEGSRDAGYQRDMKAAVQVDRLVARQIWIDMLDSALAET